MRILVDLRSCQVPPPRGGVAVYAEQLVHALVAHANAKRKSQNAKQDEFLLFANGLANPREHLPCFDAPNVQWIVTRWPNKVFNLGSAFHVLRSAFRCADAVFLPNLNFLPPLPKRTKLVVTVHDLSFEHFADCFTWKQRLWHRAIRPQILLERADAIVAVSETTKRGLVETYGIPEEKVHVVYPGIQPTADSRQPTAADIASIRRRCKLPESFILSLSEMSPRKNIDGLIAAFSMLSAIGYRLSARAHLVIAGAHGSAERALRRQITRSPAHDRIHLLGPVTEDEKHALLARASCFVYPSLWEGFGFPPLEAMGAGVPVVASTGGALPEVLGDAALLVDPLDPAAIAEAIARICADDALRTDLIARGYARAARFRWEDAAAHAFEIIFGRS